VSQMDASPWRFVACWHVFQPSSWALLHPDSSCSMSTISLYINVFPDNWYKFGCRESQMVLTNSLILSHETVVSLVPNGAQMRLTVTYSAFLEVYIHHNPPLEFWLEMMQFCLLSTQNVMKMTWVMTFTCWNCTSRQALQMSFYKL
jgi:hypothetical protein